MGHTRVPSDSGTFRLNLVEFVFDLVFTVSRAPTRTSRVFLLGSRDGQSLWIAERVEGFNSCQSVRYRDTLHKELNLHFLSHWRVS